MKSEEALLLKMDIVWQRLWTHLARFFHAMLHRLDNSRYCTIANFYFQSNYWLDLKRGFLAATRPRNSMLLHRRK